MKCPNCGHPLEDHEGHWANGELIPGHLCFHEENQGHCEDLCVCPGFYVTETIPYLDTLFSKAGI